MADYRSFCSSCGNETTFGSHAPGCANVAEFRKAEKEKRDFERALYEHYDSQTDEQIIAEFERVKFKVDAYDQAYRAADRKYKFLLDILRDKRLVDIYGRLKKDK